jgi:cyclopropane-fatty-acyl-phospholipid synthase
MNLFTIEQTRAVYRADFVFYALVIALLAGALILAAPGGNSIASLGLVVAGLLGWTALEYGIHRYILHGVQPFKRWHADHHHRPAAFICAPTVLTAGTLALLLFAPAWWAGGVWHACALTLGVLMGYLAYAITHHATHHWRTENAWLRRRQRWHFLHHAGKEPCCYGVTSGFWDHAFGSIRRDRREAP